LLRGCFSLQGSGRLSAKQLEATRRMVSRHIRKKEKIWIRAFPDIPVTTKPIQIRMGKGKGAVDHWIHKLPVGKMILEVGYMNEAKAKAVLLGAAKKLGVPCAFVNRKLDKL
jgi:large subunit ribosomal protein L16